MTAFIPTDTLDIAKAQKGVLYCVLANIVLLFFPPLVLFVIPFQLYFVYRLATALRLDYPLLWAIGMFFPIISLILLLILSQKATAAIRAAGFHVGLMGANLKDIPGGDTSLLESE